MQLAEMLGIGNDVLSLIIFGICIVIFVIDKLPMATSAILGCVAMVIFGVCDFSTAFGQFASTTVIILVAIQVVGVAMAESGLATFFGRFLSKVSRNNERIIIIVAYLMAALLSSFLTNITVLAVFLPIIIGMGTEDKKINPMNIIIPTLFGTATGGIATLVGSSQQLTAKGLIEEVGFGMGVFDLTPVGLVMVAIGLIYSAFIGYPIGKKIWGGRDLPENVSMVPAATKPNMRKVITMLVIFILMVASYVTEIIPIAATAVTAALLCILTGCVKQKEAIAKVNWDIVGRLAGCLGLAKGLNAAGGITLVSDTIFDVFGDNFTPFLLLAVSVLVTQILSLVISNSTAILIVLPVVISLQPVMNLNLLPFAVAIAIGSSMGICSPLSGSTNAMTMAYGYKFRDYLKYGVLADVLCYIGIVATTPLFFSLTL